MKIDAHIHLGKWNYRHYADQVVKIKELDKLLDRCGIDGAVIFPTDKRNNLEVLGQIRKYGTKKYWFFPWCNPRDKGLLKFLTKNSRYINGLKIHSSSDKIKGGVTSSLYKPYLDFAAGKRIPVFVHCGRWQLYASYKYVLEVAGRSRNVKFIIGHLGGDFEGLKIEAPRELKKSGLNNVWFDISATREFWSIEMGVREIGYKKFIFGSDFPVMHPQMSIASIEVLKLTQAKKEGIFAYNLLEVLGAGNLPITGGK